MSLASEYRRQFHWREWATAFAALPSVRGETVLDLGCAVGDQAAELVARGRDRFERMQLLRAACGPDFERVREEFLACHARADHRSLARVHCCIARR